MAASIFACAPEKPEKDSSEVAHVVTDLKAGVEKEGKADSVFLFSIEGDRLGRWRCESGSVIFDKSSCRNGKESVSLQEFQAGMDKRFPSSIEAKERKVTEYYQKIEQFDQKLLEVVVGIESKSPGLDAKLSELEGLGKALAQRLNVIQQLKRQIAALEQAASSEKGEFSDVGSLSQQLIGLHLELDAAMHEEADMHRRIIVAREEIIALNASLIDHYLHENLQKQKKSYLEALAIASRELEDALQQKSGIYRVYNMLFESDFSYEIFFGAKEFELERPYVALMNEIFDGIALKASFSAEIASAIEGFDTWCRKIEQTKDLKTLSYFRRLLHREAGDCLTLAKKAATETAIALGVDGELQPRSWEGLSYFVSLESMGSAEVLTDWRSVRKLARLKHVDFYPYAFDSQIDYSSLAELELDSLRLSYHLLLSPSVGELRAKEVGVECVFPGSSVSFDPSALRKLTQTEVLKLDSCRSMGPNSARIDARRLKRLELGWSTLDILQLLDHPQGIRALMIAADCTDESLKALPAMSGLEVLDLRCRGDRDYYFKPDLSFEKFLDDHEDYYGIPEDLDEKRAKFHRFDLGLIADLPLRSLFLAEVELVNRHRIAGVSQSLEQLTLDFVEATGSLEPFLPLVR